MIPKEVVVALDNITELAYGATRNYQYVEKYSKAIQKYLETSDKYIKDLEQHVDDLASSTRGMEDIY